jgi:hypothetical protein
MKPVDSTELSAYLDGELDAERTIEVAIELDSNPALRAEFDRLTANDIQWKQSARSANFLPDVTLAPSAVSPKNFPGVSALVILLVLTRILPKLGIHLEWWLLLHMLSLTIIMTCVIRMLRDSEALWREIR